jgi:two-component system, chemotaxis family, sensor kinase Cph1
VEVSARRDADAWEFTVADNGLGIDPAQGDRVFGMFERLHGEDEYGGT